jgi:RNA 3'-terminal phosphate cyclase (ATP)
MLEIDGSYGEGGGQVLRTALSLACLCQRPFRILNIRRGRKPPGLRPQHLTTVRALQLLCSATVNGAETGSTELTFAPRGVTSGEFAFDIGTAGSTSLVLQTLLPVLAFSGQKSTVILQGGTHVPFSPSYHYLAEVFVPILARLGINVRLSASAFGFYPRGGGRIRAEIDPVRQLQSLQLPARGRLLGVSGFSAVGNLPLAIAERQRTAALERLGGALVPDCPVRIERRSVPTPGRGTFLFLRLEAEYSLAAGPPWGHRGSGPKWWGPRRPTAWSSSSRRGRPSIATSPTRSSSTSPWPMRPRPSPWPA